VPSTGQKSKKVTDSERSEASAFIPLKTKKCRFLATLGMTGPVDFFTPSEGRGSGVYPRGGCPAPAGSPPRRVFRCPRQERGAGIQNNVCATHLVEGGTSPTLATCRGTARRPLVAVMPACLLAVELTPHPGHAEAGRAHTRHPHAFSRGLEIADFRSQKRADGPDSLTSCAQILNNGDYSPSYSYSAISSQQGTG
jgi:hypothetical protein